MEKYLIYQDHKNVLHRKPIKDEAKAQALIDCKKTIKIDGHPIHLVGIGTDEDYRVHLDMVGQPDYHYRQAKMKWGKPRG